jgi:purine nucleosidase
MHVCKIAQTVLFFVLASCFAFAQPRRKVIINEDCSGPGGSNMQTLMVMIQSPQVEVLGITVVSGDQWRDEEVAHTLALAGNHGAHRHSRRPGAAFPSGPHPRRIPTVAAALWQRRLRRRVGYALVARASVVPPLPEGQPTTKPADEDAAHFLIRMVRKYPHEVTIYEGGPMTNLALAISLDPQFPELAQELVFMGGSLSPQTDNPEFASNPRHEFNFWFDPEAAEIVLRARGRKSSARPPTFPLRPV